MDIVKTLKWAVAVGGLCLSVLGITGIASAQTLKIGISQPLSGANADYFQKQAVDPVLFAIEQVNAAGGLLGQKVEYVVEDHKGDPATSAAVTRKMIDVDHISMLVTSVSPAVLAALPIASRNNVVVMTLAQHPAVTATKWGFRISATGTSYGDAMSEFAWKTMQARSIALLGENNDAVRVAQVALRKRFEELGGKVVAAETFAPTDQDLHAQLSKIAAAEPDALGLASTGPRMHGLALKQATEMGIKFPKGIIANQTIVDPQLFAIAGSAASGVYYATIDFDQNWNKMFKARFGFDAESEAALTYDGVNKYFEAVKAVGSLDPVKIRDRLLVQPASPGATGTWGFNGSGEPNITPTIKRIP